MLQSVSELNQAGMYQCDHCGQWFHISDDGATHALHKWDFCSEECARAEGFEQCGICGEWLPLHGLHAYYPDPLGIEQPACAGCIESENLIECAYRSGYVDADTCERCPYDCQGPTTRKGL